MSYWTFGHRTGKHRGRCREDTGRTPSARSAQGFQKLGERDMKQNLPQVSERTNPVGTLISHF